MGNRNDFNSRPSARGDATGLNAEQIYYFISIHAPPRGATKIYSERDESLFISIHAPPRGATFPRMPLPIVLLFQFTPLREGRLHCMV